MNEDTATSVPEPNAPPASVHFGGERVTYTRRFCGNLLDGFILGFPVGVFAFIWAFSHGQDFESMEEFAAPDGLIGIAIAGMVPWALWLAFSARKGQSPGKQLLNVYVHDAGTGARVTWARVWLRDGVAKTFGPAVIGILLTEIAEASQAEAFSNLYTFIGAVVIFLNDHRRALWDHVAGTVVRYHPKGYRDFDLNEAALEELTPVERRLRELEILHNRGWLTEPEYEAKRREIISTL
jgi:uncharacterized RDD family membrane protein YckC